MANRYFRNMVILAKIQEDVGTYEAPAAATDALLISNASIGYDDQVVERDYLREFFGSAEQLIGDSPVNIEFEVELAGSGTAGTAPAWGSGMAEPAGRLHPLLAVAIELGLDL